MWSRTVALMMAGVAANAHHSLDATYDLTKVVELEGKVVTILLRNPHSFLQIEVPDQDGNTQRWALEWSSANALGKRGITRETLHVGDEVAISINPPRRPPENRGAVKTLQVTKSGPPKQLIER
jgi:hypothetical protein